MLTPQQVIDQYFLDHRCALIELAAFLDRYDAAVNRSGEPEDDHRLELIHRALEALRQPTPEEGHATCLLRLFEADA
ncbi:MAG: hypothetical protein AAF805_09985 [Planctomycetota bacterium]